MNNIINGFIKKYEYNKCNNEINIVVNIEEKDINKEIYFLDDKYYNFEEDKFIYCRNNLKELNTSNTELYINNKKYEYKKYFIPEKEGRYNIKLRFNFNLTDCSFMFVGCENIIIIDLSSFKTKFVINMKRMFNGCENLENVNLSSFDTKNVTDMSYMFSLCKKLNI